MLKQNGTLFAQYPVKRTGGVLCQTRPLFSTTRNSYAGGFSRLSAIPNGHLAPSAWVLPIAAGFMSAYTGTSFQISGTGAGALGVNIAGTASFAIDFAPATGSLVVSGAGTASFSIIGSASALAILFGSGSASFAISADGSVTAIGWQEASGSMTFSGSLTPYAIGSMSGTTIDASTLTADAIAVAVLAAAQSTPIHSNIKQVNSIDVDGSGTAGDPWGPV